MGVVEGGPGSLGNKSGTGRCRPVPLGGSVGNTERVWKELGSWVGEEIVRAVIHGGL